MYNNELSKEPENFSRDDVSVVIQNLFDVTIIEKCYKDVTYDNILFELFL